MPRTGPRKRITMEIVRVIAAQIATGSSRALACRYHGISRTGLYEYEKRHARAAALLAEADEIRDGLVEKRLFDLTKQNVTAAIFWLCNRRPDRWQNVRDVAPPVDPDRPVELRLRVIEGSRADDS